MNTPRSFPRESTPAPSGKTLGAGVIQWLKLIVPALGIGVVLAGYGLVGREMLGHPEKTDFYSFYLSAVRLRYGESLYWTAPESRPPGSSCSKDAPDPPIVHGPAGLELARFLPCKHPNLNPPLFLALGLPLTFLDAGPAWLVWSLVSLACGVLALWRLWEAKRLPVQAPFAAVLFMAGFFAYFPTLASYLGGQVTLLLLLPLVNAWLALRSGRNWAGGGWLGLAAGLKPFFTLFIVGLAIFRKGHAVAGFLLTLAGVAWAGGLVAGWYSYVDYYQALKAVSWQANITNASLSGLMAVTASHWPDSWPGDTLLAAAVLTQWGSLAVLSLLVWRLRQVRQRGWARQADTLFVLTLPAMLMLSPLGWLYYFPLLLVMALVIWEYRRSSRRWIYRSLLALALAVSSIPVTVISTDVWQNQYASAGVFGAEIYGCALLGCFLLAVRVTSGRQED